MKSRRDPLVKALRQIRRDANRDIQRRRGNDGDPLVKALRQIRRDPLVKAPRQRRRRGQPAVPPGRRRAQGSPAAALETGMRRGTWFPSARRAPADSAGRGTWRAHVNADHLADYPTRRAARRAARAEAERREARDR